MTLPNDRPQRPVEFSFQKFQQLVLAVTDDFSAGLSRNARISLKPSKDASVFITEDFTVA